MMRQLLQRTVDFVVDHSLVTLLVMMLLTGGVVAGIPQLDTSSQAGGSGEDFEDLDRVQAQQYIFENYTNVTRDRSETTIETVYVWDEDGNVLSKESLLAGLRYQQEITDSRAVQESLHDNGVRGIENLVATRAAGDENATLAGQTRALEAASPAEVDQLVGQVVSEDPRAQQFLPAGHEGTSSTDRRMLVTVNASAYYQTQGAVDTALYDTAQEQANIFVLNGPAWEDASDTFFSEMVELVVPIALLIIVSVLAFTYRDLVDVFVGMTGVVLSILWMFGLLGWLGVRAGTVSIVPVVLISGLSIDFGFHIFNRYREQRRPHEGIRAPMSRGVELVTTALILVTVTAAIGFLSNLANPLPVIQDLGVSITLGVISALVIFVTVVPAQKVIIDRFLEWVGLDRRKAALGHGTHLRPILEGSVVLAKRAAPVVLVVAVIVGAAGGLAWLNLDEESFQESDGEVAEWKQSLPEPVGWDPSPVPAQDRHVTEAYTPANAEDAIQSWVLVEGNVTSPDTLEAIDAGVGQIEEDGILLTQTGSPAERSPTTVMARVAAENETFAAVFQRADTDGDGIPDRNLESVYDAFYAADSQTAERVIERTDGEYESLLVVLSLNADYSESDEVVQTLEAGAGTMEADSQRTATVAGQLAVNSAVLSEIVDGILVTMLIALLAIGVTLTGVFRYMHGSATLGVVVALPIVLVVGLVVGGMYLLDIPLTLLTALLMSLVIGLGIDYTIHVGDRFAEELDGPQSPPEALRVAVTGTGGALLGSTLTSAGAFATIALVPHPQLRSFGGIVVIALVTSFVVSLLVLPSLLLVWSRYGSTAVDSPESAEKPVPQD
jgi:predicted RND superfamily exporter protein